MTTSPRVHPHVRGRPLADVFNGWTHEQIRARFSAKVNLAGPVPDHVPGLGPCHIWTGDHTSHGYGLLRRAGAHRVAMWLATGEEPGDRHVLHRCDNPPCVRPEHLYYGTHRQNMDDKAGRGRAGRVLKLTDAQVEEIRTRYVAGEMAKDLAPQYGISQTLAQRIVMGHTRGLTPVAVDWVAKGFGNSRQKLTDDQRTEIRRRRAAGESATALAIEFGVSPSYVSEVGNGRRPKGAAVPRKRPHRPPLAPDVVREIRALHATGTVSVGQIASRYKIDQAVASRIAARLIYRDVI